MCIYVGPEVILANLLYRQDPEYELSISTIKEFCAAVYRDYRKNAQDCNSDDIYLYFDFHIESLRSAIQFHPNIFTEFCGGIYRCGDIDLVFFNHFYFDTVTQLLVKHAQNFSFFVSN